MVRQTEIMDNKDNRFTPEVIDELHKMWHWNKHTKERLKVIPHNSGAWSEGETRLLEKNVDEYLKMHGINTAQDILYSSSNKGHRNPFLHYCAKGVYRPILAIYKKIRAIYSRHPELHNVPFTSDEANKIHELYEQYGNNWVLIGDMIGRNPLSVNDFFRSRLQFPEATSFWTDEELEILKREGGKPNRSWLAIAYILKTKTPTQCRYTYSRLERNKQQVKKRSMELSHKAMRERRRKLKEKISQEKSKKCQQNAQQQKTVHDNSTEIKSNAPHGSVKIPAKKRKKRKYVKKRVYLKKPLRRYTGKESISVVNALVNLNHESIDQVDWEKVRVDSVPHRSKDSVKVRLSGNSQSVRQFSFAPTRI